MNATNQTELQAQIEFLMKQNATLKAEAEAAKKASERKLTLKVTDGGPKGEGSKGAVCLYGLGRFPVTLYASQWERLIEHAPAISTFLKANAPLLARK